MPLFNNSNKDDFDYFDDNMEMDKKVEMFVKECRKRDKGYQGWFGSMRLQSWDKTGEQGSEIFDIQVISYGVGFLN